PFPLMWTDDSIPKVRLIPPPKELPVEQAFDYLLKHHRQARYCPNLNCPAPYFFAKRHTQRYCSSSCAQSGERETKRKWWAEHGADWRKAQKQAATTIKKQKRTAKKKREENSHA